MTLPVTTPVDTFGEPGEPVPIGAVFAGAIGTLTGTVEVPPWPSETVRLNVSVVADRSAPVCRSCVPCGRIRRVGERSASRDNHRALRSRGAAAVGQRITVGVRANDASRDNAGGGVRRATVAVADGAVLTVPIVTVTGTGGSTVPIHDGHCEGIRLSELVAAEPEALCRAVEFGV